MGHRANFVLIDESGPRLFYSHWAANTVYSVVVAGPAAATRFAMVQRPCDIRTEWLDDVWCEGGAVIDHTTRTLTYFGDGLAFELPTKQVFADLLPSMWPGWTVRWAYDGIGDLAAAAGFERDMVRKPDDDERALPAQLTADLDDAHLLTVRTTHVLTVFPLPYFLHTAWQGPALLDHLPPGGTPRLALTGLPCSGLHVDIPARTAGVWLRDNSSGLVPALPTLWPDWRVEFWEDRYGNHLARCGGAVTIPPQPPRTAVLDDLIAHLQRRLGDNPVPRMLDLMHTHADESRGGSIQINPWVTEHHPEDPTAAEWAAVLHAAVDLRTQLDAHR
ncbi:hypothetical protein H0264_29345 [Nocardia huaxiensis]|uniref:Uncharacterized protein n=1 Tax=Nocardia huaxiensis TaxID=2755382 RepID=A0A7D6Z839_9NOCA|nr:hypothetical protein [Nocardia huaxiensis]QLY29348.1 hypothetical protein H0264_29345 [Nocardia huaxiensis]